jgi:hypothetical protein
MRQTVKEINELEAAKIAYFKSIVEAGRKYILLRSDKSLGIPDDVMAVYNDAVVNLDRIT